MNEGCNSLSSSSSCVLGLRQAPAFFFCTSPIFLRFPKIPLFHTDFELPDDMLKDEESIIKYQEEKKHFISFMFNLISFLFKFNDDDEN